MKKLQLLAGCCLLAAMTGCIKNGEEGKLCFSRTSTQLITDNQTTRAVYYLAFNQNILPYIDWAAVCSEDRKVTSGNQVSVDLNTVTGYVSGEPIVVYWWTCRAGTPGAVNTVVLSSQQKKCN
jgi:hypothetical protein